MVGIRPGIELDLRMQDLLDGVDQQRPAGLSRDVNQPLEPQQARAVDRAQEGPEQLERGAGDRLFGGQDEGADRGVVAVDVMRVLPMGVIVTMVVVIAVVVVVIMMMVAGQGVLGQPVAQGVGLLREIVEAGADQVVGRCAGRQNWDNQPRTSRIHLG